MPRKGASVAQISAIFWDVGGVLLSNAWDRFERTQALAKFGLDQEEFHDRHEMVVSSFERGKLSLDDYLDRVIFYRTRPFSKEEFKKYMFSLSKPKQDILDLAAILSRSNRYLMGTINNESKEINSYRIETFRLRQIFTVFMSSCFVGFRKPEPDIYRVALEVTQKNADQCCFIDDRGINLEGAQRLGMHPIRLENASQLRQRLSELGIELS
jgi:putative hydrolase of the HAD superfamily